MPTLPRWAPIAGKFSEEDGTLLYHGGLPNLAAQSPGAQAPATLPTEGYAVLDERFAGGSLSAVITFDSVPPLGSCELIVFHDPKTTFRVTAGLGGGGGMYSIRQNDGKQWTTFRAVGDRNNLAVGQAYAVRVTTRGSRVGLNVNGVDVLAHDLPYPVPASQVGVYCYSDGIVRIADIAVDAQRPRAFVVMQFSSPYDEVYSGVIRAVCQEFKLDVIRADEESGPGLIIADIAKQITEAAVVIADVSPANANVYYEVGYAHALNKPTVLMAERSTKLPFDVSPFRTLFYENTIDGKARLEEGLRRHLRTILNQRPPGDNNS